MLTSMNMEFIPGISEKFFESINLYLNKIDKLNDKEREIFIEIYKKAGQTVIYVPGASDEQLERIREIFHKEGTLC